MIHVCDAIMGSGKSQSAISHINEHPDRKFVYITPYLDEADRIRVSCPNANFKAPSDKIPEYQFSKLNHTHHLLTAGENITTTHASFRMYTQDMLSAISQNHYTLIIDEAVDVLTEAEYSKGDIKMLIDAGYIVKTNEGWEHTNMPYGGGRLDDLFSMLKCNNLVQANMDDRGTSLFYWALPSSVIRAFSEVFVLTYLFNGHDLRYYLDMNGIPFDFIGIHRKGDIYKFSDVIDYIPDYVSNLGGMIHIFDNQKLNAIGDSKHNLSDNWFKKDKFGGVDILKNNLYNFLRNYSKATGDQIMWSTYKDKIGKLSGRGFKKQHVAFTAKATNKYRDRCVLAYLVNVFAKPDKIAYFASVGIDYDIDAFALSTMIQWIWRSAIRDGKEIWIYVPSERMRSLLTIWIAKTQNESAGRK